MKLSKMADLLIDLSYAYPNAKLPTEPGSQEGFARVWHGALGELDEQHVQAAVKQWIKTEQWFPTPAQIRQAAIRLQTGLPAPGVAWEQAQRAASSRDRSVYDSIHTVALMALRDIGGPAAITNATDLGRVRESYLKSYAERVGSVYVAPDIVTENVMPSVRLGGDLRMALGGGQD